MKRRPKREANLIFSFIKELVDLYVVFPLNLHRVVLKLDDRGSRVRFPAGAEKFSLHHRVQNGSEAHPASYPIGTRGSFLAGKAAGA
jgi:hypothetical protein